jgi:Arc/MetJ-type ribon-helix-helix transcriptional regulator
MKTISVKVPDQVASEAKSFVKAGCFDSESDVFLAAIADFLRRNRIELVERFERQDIAWAKKEARKSA